MYHIMRRMLGSGAVVLALSALWMIPQVFAGTIQISPAFVDLTIKPGDSAEYEMQVKNVGTEPMNVEASLTDFTYTDSGEKVFVEEGGLPGEERFSLREWIGMDVDDAFTLEPGEVVYVPITIAVPEDAEPGGHYGVLFMSMMPAGSTETGTQIGVSGRIGSLVLVDVPGNIVRDAEVKAFEVGIIEGGIGEEKFLEQKSFELGPISFRIEYHNLGTTHYYPEGTVTVTGGFKNETWKVALQPESQIEKRRALPRVTSDFTATLHQRNLFGKYTATLEMQDGDEDQLPVEELTFWVMPIKTVVLWVLSVVVGLLVLGFLVRRYNHWIRSKAQSAG